MLLALMIAIRRYIVEPFYKNCPWMIDTSAIDGAIFAVTPFNTAQVDSTWLGVRRTCYCDLKGDTQFHIEAYWCYDWGYCYRRRSPSLKGSMETGDILIEE